MALQTGSWNGWEWAKVHPFGCLIYAIRSNHSKFEVLQSNNKFCCLRQFVGEICFRESIQAPFKLENAALKIGTAVFQCNGLNVYFPLRAGVGNSCGQTGWTYTCIGVKRNSGGGQPRNLVNIFGCLNLRNRDCILAVKSQKCFFLITIPAEQKSLAVKRDCVSLDVTC